MKIILVIILSIFFYPPIKTQVICDIAEKSSPSEYSLDQDKYPAGCEIFVVGQYYIDIETSNHFAEADKYDYIGFGQ